MHRYASPHLPRGWSYVMITESAYTRPRSVSRKELEWALEHTVEGYDEDESRVTAGMTRWELVCAHSASGWVLIFADESCDGRWARVFHSHKMSPAQEAEWIRGRGVI